MNPIQYILQHFPFMVLDGAMATELERRGADLNNSLWSAQLLLENPEWIADVHREYFEVGADCAITASYQATIEGFVQKGLTEQEAIHLIQQSVQLAVEARDQFGHIMYRNIVPSNRSKVQQIRYNRLMIMIVLSQ